MDSIFISKFLVMSFLSCLISMFLLTLNFNKFLDILITLEFFILNLFTILMILLNSEMILNFLLYFLVIVVCESCMGLSILVSMSRLNSNLNFNSKSFYLC